DSVKWQEDMDCVLFDADNDGDADLLITSGDTRYEENSDYYKPRYYTNDGKGNFNLQPNVIPANVKTITGCVSAGDYDNDGDMDLVAGNLGLNCDYKASVAEPMELYAGDMDGNGSIDPVFFYYIKGNDGKRKSFPAINRTMLASQVPAIKKQFLLNSNYANASFEDIFKGKKDNLLHFSCIETRRCYFDNTGIG